MFAMKLTAITARQTTLCHPNLNNPTNRCGTRGVKVTVVGAAGRVGQSLSLLLKLNPQITTLALHDRYNTKGIATDLSHICTATEVQSYDTQELSNALENASIVVVSGGINPMSDVSEDQMLQANVKIARNVAKEIGTACPDALVAIAISPLNTIVPVVAQQLLDDEVYDPRRLFGVTTSDVIRAKTLIGRSIGEDPLTISIPVVGGHAGVTTLPLISQSQPIFDGTQLDQMELIESMQDIDRAGNGQLLKAYAIAHFINSLLRALKNERNIIECAYVQSDVSEARFFASPVLLGPKGVVENLGLPDLNELEEDAVEQLVKILIKDIDRGLKSAMY